MESDQLLKTQEWSRSGLTSRKKTGRIMYGLWVERYQIRVIESSEK